MAKLLTTWTIAHPPNPPPATIRIKNLQAFITVGKDAWNHSHQTQPILISASVHLREHFNSASDADVLDSTTLNYSSLAKRCLQAAKNFHGKEDGDGGSVRELVDGLLRRVSGFDFYGEEKECEEGEERRLVDVRKVGLLEIEVMLPKASLLGMGVSLKGMAIYDPTGCPTSYSMSLSIHKLRIPTLIGLNDYERNNKQTLVVSVVIDCWDPGQDLYNELEEIVVKTVEESSFQTLEALAPHIGWRILQYFILPTFRQSTGESGTNPERMPTIYQRIHIILEKPCLVPFSEAPVVEIDFDTDPDVHEGARGLWQGWRQSRKVPFPLGGRLDEWIGGEEEGT